MNWNLLLRQNLAFQKLKKNNNLLNAQDINGNCIIHALVDYGDYALLKEFLDSFDGINYNVQDEESGYTPLHRAFFKGFLNAALLLADKSDCLHDNEGKCAFELLNSTLPVIIGDVTTELSDDASVDSNLDYNSINWSVWSWGSNSNYLLGSEKKDPSLVFPQKATISLPMAIGFKQVKDLFPQVLQVVLSKYHSCIVTSSGLYTCGFGKKGRLGLGNEDSVLKPVKVDIKDIQFVGLGPDHTLAVTFNGDLWSWGNNENGTLGYQLESSFQVSPKLVTNGLKKIKVIAAAGSNVHSAVISDSGNMYCWGSNNGQLGFKSVEIQWTPRKVTNFPTQQMSHVAVTNTSTAVLTHNSEVYVFMNYEYFKVNIQTGPISSPSPFVIRNMSAIRFTKLTSGLYQYAVITNDGDVYMWVPPSKEFRESWEQNLLLQTKPVCVWKARNSSLKAIDVAIGIDSNVLIGTESGYAYCGRKRLTVNTKNETKKKKSGIFKFCKLSHLQHIRFVAASSSGAYYAIRADLKQYYIPPPDSFQENMRDYLEFTKSSSLQSLLADIKIHAMDGNIHFCHKSVLSARSHFFKKLFKNGSSAGRLFQYKETDGIHSLSFPEFNTFSIKMILEYIYCGELHNTWDFSAMHKGKFNDVDENGSITQAREYRDFKELVKLLELDDTEIILYSTSSSHKHRYTSQFLNLFQSGQYSDVVFALKDQELYGHAIILAARSPFFAAILGRNRNLWDANFDEKKRRIIDLRHMDPTLFSVVLRWIYGEPDISDICEQLSANTVNGLLQHLVDLIAISEELLLQPLKDIIAYFFSSFIHIGNVWELLETSIKYQAKHLKLTCLDFGTLSEKLIVIVCWNLETFFERKTFSTVDQSLIPVVESHLKELQTKTFSAVRGPDGYSRIKTLAIMAETERKEKKREEYLKQQDDPKYSPIMSLNLDDEVEYFTEIPQRIPKNIIGALQCTSNTKDDVIFEMDIEEAKPPQILTKVKSWKTPSLIESGPSSVRSSPSLSPWPSVSVQEKSKVDFREVMNSQDQPVRHHVGKSPTMSALITRRSSAISPLMLSNDSNANIRGPDRDLRRSFKKQSPTLLPQSPSSLNNIPPMPTREYSSYNSFHISPARTSPIMLNDSFQNAKRLTNKMNQKERRRQEKITSPVSATHTITTTPWQASSPTQKSASLKDIQKEELFRRQSLPGATECPPISWAHAARLSPGKK